MTEEEYLKSEIFRLKNEIQKKEKQVAPTHKRGIVTEGEFDSDLGMKVPRETMGWVSMSLEEKKAAQEQIDLEIYELKRRLKQLEDKLFLIDWNKPDNVAERQEKNRISEKKEQEKQLKDERLEHGERYDDLNKLVEYLEIVGMDDLARRLSQLRFAFQKSKNDYVVDEIDIRSKENYLENKTITTKKEYKEIKKSVIKLTKDATRMAKRYKDLYNLYISAGVIIQDMEEKGILRKQGYDLVRALEIYFKQPTGKYYFKDKQSINNYSIRELSNLGYEFLAFYRDYNSKYNEDVRKRKI